ncbi:MAG: HAD family hydrolase [Coriobacteriaceae bacterium]|jgi:phosphoglycolate phosphatase|nr:HAD family hydrolase [Coriobacteriaceae bacterium]
MKKTYDTFVFDLDGTLLDTLPDLVVLTNKALRKAGLPPRTKDEILSFVGDGATALLRRSIPPSVDEAGVLRILETWKEMYPDYGDCLTKEFPGMTDLVRALCARGMNVGVLSNKFDAGVRQLMDKHFPGMFQVARGEAPDIPRKPDPKGLLIVIDELGGVPDRTLYIGDSPNDIVTAHRIGALAVGVSWGYYRTEKLVEAGADAIVKEPSEILELFVQASSQ